MAIPIPSETSKERETLEKKLITSEKQLSDRRQRVTFLSEENKKLKRKLDRLENQKDQMKRLKESVTASRKETQVLQRNLVRANKLIAERKCSTESTRQQHHYKVKYNESRQECVKLKNTVKSLEINMRALNQDKGEGTILDKLQELEAENNKLKTDYSECVSSIDYLEQLLADDGDNTVVLYDESKREYTKDAVKCIMNLTDLKVPSQKVGPVIKEVAELCGKVPNQLPSRTTVDSVVDRKLSVAQKQLSLTLKQKQHTTLYTDETRKYGKTMQSYIVTDDDQTSYVIGLREMFNKSGLCTLDTFKDILHDISSLCEKMEGDASVGFQILKNIQNTMSDRAGTEKNFNKLLEDYRKEILPVVIENWEELDEDQRKITTSMNNFFVYYIYWLAWQM
ncbi:uncharacterized protein LOC134275330 [Saccostrea cucullata]|uniref:uncharacterized protein LOC134275330 n=1 Tax=Saccostrea cuccullata TaxID=36930 RepID=UPI002ED25154